MPLINGLKMACEPCIRGHRSTKCTHADERLMVPVRKPGRPLSACPHPREASCGCGTVTAAIPKRQQCRCGGDTQASSEGQHVASKPSESPIADVPSPTKVSFKVQKSFRLPPGKKQSFDAANLERMDMNSVNVMAYEQKPQMMPVAMSNGYAMTSPPQMYGFVPQYPFAQPQYGHTPIQPPPLLPGRDDSMSYTGAAKSFGNGIVSPSANGLGQCAENPLSASNLKNKSFMNGRDRRPSSSASNVLPKANGEAEDPTHRGSCCGPKTSSDDNGHSQNSSMSSILDAPKHVVASCCAPKTAPQTLKTETSSSNGTPAILTPQVPEQMLPQAVAPFQPGLYPQYMPQPAVFTYPPTYGSFQNPLQPYAWRQNMRDNTYGPSQAQMPLPNASIPFDAQLTPENPDTIHNCNCGHTCQCIGCAAHPYNDATQDYVRSAWASMTLDRPPHDIQNIVQTPVNMMVHANGNGNGNSTLQPQPGDPASSPTAHTPSSTNSANGDEQSLSASDFFFVNYPFTSDGCGGDTQSCPCGDDCQCLGCTIHRGPSMPCGGEKGSCPCGDSCECIGCTLHNPEIVA